MRLFHRKRIHWIRNTVPMLLALCLCARPTIAQEAEPAPFVAVSGEVDLNSRYLWRGIAFSEGTVYQPSLTASHAIWSLNAWANVDPGVISGPQMNELDLTLAAATQWHDWSVKPSAVLYAFPGVGTPATAELMIELGRAMGPWAPYTRHSVDIMEFEGAAYSAVGVNYTYAIPKRADIAANLEYGRGWWRFANAYADPSLEGMNVMSGVLSATFPLPNGVELRPHASWNRVGNRSVRDEISGPTPFQFGVAIGREF